MKINRSNYELWFIDWLDGNLSENLVDQLKIFMSENPDLKEELDELTKFRLNPNEHLFPDKNCLIKTTSDLSVSQFEYLCVAYLENDLPKDQQEELMKSIEQDPEKKISFELIQKMKLSPAAEGFKHKDLLIKRTVAQKVIRLSVIGFSVAAAIAVIFLNYFIVPRSLPDHINNTSQSIPGDSIVKPPQDKQRELKVRTENPLIIVNKQSKILVARTEIKAIPNKGSSVNPEAQYDSLARASYFTPIFLNKVPCPSITGVKRDPLNNSLIALNTKMPVPEYDDGRSRLSKFIAKTFREKILREKTTKDTPLKGYEIAEAGVTGLNKLFGWEMALDERKDENGVLQSVYFSSKILKFNAPVKKSEPLP